MASDSASGNGGSTESTSTAGSVASGENGIDGESDGGSGGRNPNSSNNAGESNNGASDNGRGQSGSGPSARPAAEGEKLVEITQPPERTLAMFELEEGLRYPEFDATVEPFGVKGRIGDDGVPRELVVQISSWQAQSNDSTDLNLKGRNAIMQVQIPPEQAKKLMVGGSYQVVVRVVSQGGTGSLAIVRVK